MLLSFVIQVSIARSPIMIQTIPSDIDSVSLLSLVYLVSHTTSKAYYNLIFINGYFYSMGETVIWRTENGSNWTKWSHTWNKIAPQDSLAVGMAAGLPVR